MEKLSNKELMIGNYVRGFWYNYDDDEKEMSDILEVNCIDDVGVTDYGIWASGTNVSAEMYHKLEPIELTEDILIRLGFVKEMIKDEYQEELKASEGFRLGKTLVALFRENDKSDCIDFLVVKRDTFINIVSYLHQLQNTVYWTAGKQLTLKEE